VEYAALTEKIIGCAFRVYNSMGFGYLESVYENSLLLELQREGVRAEPQTAIPVQYDGRFVGHFVADLVVEDTIIVELKSVRQLTKVHEIQLVNYLAATGREIGLLINFGEHRVEIKRKHRTAKRSLKANQPMKNSFSSNDPVHPCDPVRPVNSLRSNDPVHPCDPVSPVARSNPVDPRDPVHPVNSLRSKSPVHPCDPVSPVARSNPVDPCDPVHPVKTNASPQNSRPPKEWDFFLAGVIQGSHEGAHTHSQDYRDEIKAILAKKAPGRKVFCPVENHRHSVTYTDEEARKVFFGHIEILRRSRVMIAYLPTASMGTAVEMAVCKEEGIPIVTITPMALNWVVRLYSHAVVPDFKAFAKWLTKKNLKKLGI